MGTLGVIIRANTDKLSRCGAVSFNRSSAVLVLLTALNYYIVSGFKMKNGAIN